MSGRVVADDLDAFGRQASGQFQPEAAWHLIDGRADVERGHDALRRSRLSASVRSTPGRILDGVNDRVDAGRQESATFRRAVSAGTHPKVATHKHRARDEPVAPERSKPAQVGEQVTVDGADGHRECVRVYVERIDDLVELRLGTKVDYLVPDRSQVPLGENVPDDMGVRGSHGEYDFHRRPPSRTSAVVLRTSDIEIGRFRASSVMLTASPWVNVFVRRHTSVPSRKCVAECLKLRTAKTPMAPRQRVELIALRFSGTAH